MGQAWDRHAGEPLLWFDRFERYRLAGSGRSMLAIYNAERQEKAAARGRDFAAARSVPGAWDNNADKWQWKVRAEAWDEAEVERRRIEFREERLRRRERRQAVLDEVFEKLATLVTNLDKKASAGQLSMLLKEAFANERAEFDDEPATRLKWDSDDGSPPTFNFILQQIEQRPAADADDDHPDDDD